MLGLARCCGMTSTDKSQDYDEGRLTFSSFLRTPRPLARSVVTGVFCFGLSLFLFYGTVLRVPLQRTDLLNLGPYPDAVEYFAQARSILTEGSPSIQIGRDKLPSRYPPGYSLLMIPWLRCLPHHGIFAPFRTNQTIGLSLLILGFAFYFAIGKPLAGGLGTLLLVTQPAFISFSRSSLSDLSGATAGLLAFMLVYIGLRYRRRWPVYSAAIVLGLALCIRPQLLFLAPLLMAAALFPSRGSWSKWFLHCCLTVLVFVAASIPYFAFNTFEFGHPLKTGYNFWVPGWAESNRLFSLHNVPAQLAMLLSEITASWSEFRVANLFGTGTYIVPSFALLALLGLAFVRVNRFTVSASLAWASYFIATLTYAFVDGRFYLPLFLLLIPVAILPAEWAVSNALNPHFSVSTAAVVALFLLTCLGFPSQSGFKPEKNRFQTWDALHYPTSKTRSRNYEAQKQLASLFRDAPGIVLSDIDPAYLNVLLPKPFVAAPIDGKHNYCYSRLWHYDKADAIQLITGALEQAVPVYALFVPSEHLDQDLNRLPRIQGCTWKRSDRSGTAAVIMLLTKETTGNSNDSIAAHKGFITQ